MGNLNDLPMGFREPVDDAQGAFRAALRALSHPGDAVDCGAQVPAVPGLMPATVALLLALTDHETPVWWVGSDGPAPWLRFHTGAPSATRVGQAHFAVISRQLSAEPWPELELWNAGTDESPDRSTTLLIELPSLSGGAATVWSGPGLREARTLYLAGLPASFSEEWCDNHARFPRGVDVLFLCGRHIVGLPRTTLVQSVAAR
jgi:alpha-D-ribose 1-methylphosphonate 5-triphosphate synthase subunit PhnH